MMYVVVAAVALLVLVESVTVRLLNDPRPEAVQPPTFRD
jgi:hypothetical protein